MTTIDLTTATIANTSKLLENHELSPVELTRATLERIDRLDHKIGSFTTVTGDYAIAKARQAETEIAKGDYRGPLHGIPYTLKDLIDTNGIRTTYGYSSHQDYVPQRSAAVHQRLEEAGAVLVGKVDCHFRRNIPVSCRNPWDLSRSPGISSSGSGASLAASLCLASIGSDTGGSVRIPASWSGVVGLRGTLGLLSRHNALGPSWSFDQLGPLAKSVEDIALLFGVVAGFDPNDPISLRGPLPNYAACLNGNVKGVRVGVLQEFVSANCTEDVEAATRDALTVLEGLGAQLSDVSIPHSAESKRVLTVVSEAESAVDYPRVFPKERLDNIDDDLKEYLASGRFLHHGGVPGGTTNGSGLAPGVGRRFPGRGRHRSPYLLDPRSPPLPGSSANRRSRSAGGLPGSAAEGNVHSQRCGASRPIRALRIRPEWTAHRPAANGPPLGGGAAAAVGPHLRTGNRMAQSAPGPGLAPPTLPSPPTGGARFKTCSYSPTATSF